MEEIKQEKKNYYDEEKRKEYNKKYYETNKAIILGSILNKEECKYCGKTVTHQNMVKHMDTKLCLKKFTQKQKFINTI